MWPFNGERFPYSNMHQMNQDWIILQVKKFGHDLEEYKQQLDQMGIDIEEFRNYIDGIDEEIQQKIDQEVPLAIEHEVQTGGFNQLLSDSHKRRIICIGDSYGDGWTPDGSFPSWITKLKAFLNIADSDFTSASAGGAAFGKPASVPQQYIPTLIQTAFEHISNPITVTDVIFGLGYNDYLYADEPATIKAGINTAITSCKQKFPNARIHIFGIGFCADHAIQWKLNAVYQAYSTTLNDYQFYNITEALSQIDGFSTDGIHPLESGQQNIALYMARLLNNSDDTYTYISDRPGSSIVWDMLIGGTQEVNSLFIYAKNGKRLYLSNTGAFKIITFDTPVNIPGATMTKIAKLKSSPFTGYFYHRNYITTQAVMYYSVAGDNDFQSIPIDITLAQDSSDNDVYLWIETKAMSGSGFASLSNVTRIGFIGACIELPFITKL